MLNRKRKKIMGKLHTNKIPLLVLDETWCTLFPHREKNEIVLRHENRLKQLLQFQRDYSDKLQLLSNQKKELLNKILTLTSEAFGNNNIGAKSQMEQAQADVLRINAEMDELQGRIRELPEEIDSENIRLFKESMYVCYDAMMESEREVNRLTPLIDSLHRQLAEGVEQKSFHEDNYEKMRTFLVGFVGQTAVDELAQAHKEGGRGIRYWYRYFRDRAHAKGRG